MKLSEEKLKGYGISDVGVDVIMDLQEENSNNSSMRYHDNKVISFFLEQTPSKHAEKVLLLFMIAYILLNHNT